MRKQRRENGREKKYAGIKPALKSVGFLILIVLGVAVLALGRGRILETRIYEVPDRVSREEKSGGSRNVDSAVSVGRLDLSGTMEDINYRVVMQVLAEEGMNRTLTAKRLGISRATLWRILNRSGK